MERYNSEHYEDLTAWEAMRHAEFPDYEEAAGLDGDGSLLLVEAVVRAAFSDYARAVRRPFSRRAAAQARDIERFFRSDYFRRLTGLRGEKLLQGFRKELKLK